MSRDGWGGAAARSWVRLVLAHYGTTCHLCGHDGADSGDHIRPRSTIPPEQWHDVANGRPVHHKPCPVCGVRCNIRRKTKPVTAAQPLDELTFFDAGPG